MDKAILVKLFNEWMKRYTEHPEQFEHEWETIHEFLTQQKAGEVPTYGDECVAYLEKLLFELS